MERVSAIEAANENLRQLDVLRKSQDQVISKINKMHVKLSQTSPETAERFSEKIWTRLRALYAELKSYADDEDRVSTSCISQLDALILPGQASTHRKKPEVGEPKRKRMKADNDPSRLSSPSLPHRSPTDHGTVLVGDQVAARVSQDSSDKDDWIVVKVTRYDREANKVEVIDEEPGDDEECAQRKYKLPFTCIIPFPKRTDPSSAPDFPTNSQVLAVYPGTTALYKATVAGPHRKRKNEDYLLEFDDDEEDGVDGLPKRPVPFYHVVQLPEGHRQ